MESELKRRLMWHLRVSWRRAGAAGVLAVFVLLPGIVGLVWWDAVIGEAEISRIKREIVDLRAQRAAGVKAPDRDRNLPLQIVEYYEFFPAKETAFRWVGTIQRIALAKGLAFDRAEYRQVREKGDKLLRYEVTLPLKGPYASVRDFVTAVLNELPHAALESLSFERQRVVDPVIEAQVKFVIFLRLQ